jgi:hypothetical protein
MKTPPPSHRTTILQAYHYEPGSDGAPYRKSERQDIQFVVNGDSLTIVLPPPAACILYIVATPRTVLALLKDTLDPEPKT